VQKAIRRMGELIANKLLHTPLSALKASEQVDVETMVEVTQRLFALEGPVERSPSTTAAAPAPPPAMDEVVRSQGKKA
jgi:Glutamyl-tRNAGlu reductase, dimerisation domain